MNSRLCIMALLLCFSQALLGHFTVIEEIEKLKKYFNSSSSDVGDQKDIVSDILRNWQNDRDVKVIESQIVSFYLKLFEALKEHKTIQESINTIRADLIVNFFNNSREKMDDFIKLTTIPVNDLQVQRKAVNELVGVMHRLSSNIRRKKKGSRCCFGGGDRLNQNYPARSI
uniref:Interferon gamma n=1 Tax=Sigmodon hispidus TaxID=42415 RepID=IFNG_SIGHI|nr:RecName: Full=Interferon gamma; Short=IFN-gamma; Flags: Precursor [Sigmodon hispidus]AAF21433.1 interferon-gamma [Sigmodon hispidus]